MKNSEYLHGLIRSMNKRDKDNFQRYARVRGKKADHKYLDLFRAIEQQEVYDEELLKSKFSFSNFSEAKNHLSGLILRCLRIYDTHPETEMQNRLTEIRLLMERSLHHFALKKINQARKFALEEERFAALQALADYELEALPFVAAPAVLPIRRQEVLAARDEARHRQAEWHRLQDIQDKEINTVIGQTARSGQFTPEGVHQIESLPEMQASDEQLSARARSMKYRILNVIRHHQLDFERRAQVLEKVLENFERNPFLIAEEPVRYIFSLGGYGVCLNVVGRHEEALSATMKLLGLRSESDHLRRSVFLNFASNLAIYTLNTGDVEPFSEHLGYLMQGLRLHRDHTPPGTLAYIHYLLAINFWLAGDLRRANRFARRVVREPAGRVNLQAACRCFMLIFAYEDDDLDFVQHSIHNWRRQWKKKAPAFAVEEAFGRFMMSLTDLADWREQDQAFQACLAELEELLREGFRVRKDNFIFLLHWLRARIGRRSLVQVVQEQV